MVALASGRTTPVSLLRQPYCSLAARDFARTAVSARAGETSRPQTALVMVSVTTNASTTKRRCRVTEEEAAMRVIRFISKYWLRGQSYGPQLIGRAIHNMSRCGENRSSV